MGYKISNHGKSKDHVSEISTARKRRVFRKNKHRERFSQYYHNCVGHIQLKSTIFEKNMPMIRRFRYDMSFAENDLPHDMLRKIAQRNIDSNFVKRTNHRRKIIDDLEVKKGTAPTDSSSLQSNLKRRIVTFGDGLKGIPQNFSNPQTVTTYCLGLMEMWLIHLLRRKDQKEAYRRIALRILKRKQIGSILKTQSRRHWENNNIRKRHPFSRVRVERKSNLFRKVKANKRGARRVRWETKSILRKAPVKIKKKGRVRWSLHGPQFQPKKKRKLKERRINPFKVSSTDKVGKHKGIATVNNGRTTDKSKNQAHEHDGNKSGKKNDQHQRYKQVLLVSYFEKKT